ncbi:MAG TPA: dihydrofolate reductase family protein [Candidatus Dormibacteraeota bacterium]|nr:dihydrofolate reductase family protein [Candidatus Dormibacteraeota bacterium]
MSRTVSHLSISLDGFIAGPDQGPENPMGTGGDRLHEWARRGVATGYEPDVALRGELLRPMGAFVMGRNMFGPVRGEWTGDWRGWWGDEPPYHAPVFVLTHHPRAPIEMAGGTVFHFVTDGFAAALERAREVAGEADVRIAGGASTVRQALRAGVVDELLLDVAPVLLHSGEGIFDGIHDLTFEPLEVVDSPHATHVRYRVTR